MIAELIDKFNYETNQTLHDFNVVFKMRIEGDDNLPVEIGGVELGERRVVKINDKIHLIDIHNNPRLRKSTKKNMFRSNNCKYYMLFKKGSDYTQEPIDIFKDIYELSDYLKYSRNYINNRIKHNKGLIGDYKIIRKGNVRGEK